jgi:hypothetical protein
MLKAKTIRRIEELVAARLPDLDTSLKQETARIGADLISRGLHNSSILVGDTKAAAERNLDQRAKVIQRTIEEVCRAHHVRYSHTLSTELVGLFNRLYEDQLRKVTARFNSAIPVQNRMLSPMPVPEPKPNVDRHTQSLLLFTEELAGKTWRDLKKTISSLGFGLLRRLVGL